MKLKKEDIGNVLQIQLDASTFALGRIIGGGFIEFYDKRLTAEITGDIANVTDLGKVLFTLSVHKSWTKNEKWKVVGNNVADIPQAPPQFMQNMMNPLDIKIVDSAGGVAPATKAEIIDKKLERLAVWEDNHIEDRLRDYFANKTNAWVEHLKVK